MKTRIAFIIGVLLLAGCLTAPTHVVQTIPASDKCFRYEGRFDFADTNSPVVIWQASRISIDFEGDTLTLLFDGAKNQNFFNAQIDNSTTIVEVNEGMPPKGTTFAGLGKGRHHLVLSKRSEANAGSVHFRGIQIGEGAKVWSSAPMAYKLRMEFIGDSKTVGACNEDANTDQWGYEANAQRDVQLRGDCLGGVTRGPPEYRCKRDGDYHRLRRCEGGRDVESYLPERVIGNR